MPDTLSQIVTMALMDRPNASGMTWNEAAAIGETVDRRYIDALTAATVAAINDHADIRLPDGRLAIARDHAVEVIRGVLEPHDA
jgi:hypothetical protein